jgi:hypothetical protein
MPGLPAVDDVIAQAMAKDPAQRRPSPGGFADALSDILAAPAAATTAAGLTAPTRRAPRPRAPMATHPTALRPGGHRPTAPRDPVVGATALVLIAGAAAAFALTSGNGGSTATTNAKPDLASRAANSPAASGSSTASPAQTVTHTKTVTTGASKRPDGRTRDLDTGRGRLALGYQRLHGDRPLLA